MMLPPMQPHLRDELIELRPMRADDFDALFAIAADREIWALHPAHDRWQEPVFRAFFEEGLASNRALVAVAPDTGTPIGSSRYDIRVCEVGEVEIGWTFLARKHWGGTVNRAMKRLMIGHALANGFDAVIFLVGETNLRSRRALEKVGAVLTDRHQDWPMADGVVSHLIYRIDRTGFESGPLS